MPTCTIALTFNLTPTLPLTPPLTLSLTPSLTPTLTPTLTLILTLRPPQLECCKQSICSFCLADYVLKRSPSVGDETASLKPVLQASLKPILPAGVACPQCTTVNKTRSQSLRRLEAGDETERMYVTSPKTSQHLAALQRRDAPSSPLKVSCPSRGVALHPLLPNLPSPPPSHSSPCSYGEDPYVPSLSWHPKMSPHPPPPTRIPSQPLLNGELFMLVAGGR